MTPAGPPLTLQAMAFTVVPNGTHDVDDGAFSCAYDDVAMRGKDDHDKAICILAYPAGNVLILTAITSYLVACRPIKVMAMCLSLTGLCTVRLGQVAPMNVYVCR